MRFRVGLVGTGFICEYHVAALRRLPDVEIIGVCDVDPQRAQTAAERFGVRHFTSLARLREAGADVIHVLTPPHTHAAVVMEALELGCHVYVEKPVAEDVEDCRRIEQRAAERGLQVCVGHSLLFDPQVQRALDTVRQGKLGRIVSVDILRSSTYPPYEGGTLPPPYRGAGYPFRDLGVHGLYLLQEFLGPIGDVQASWASLGGEPNLAYDEWRAQVRCRDGLGQIQLSWNVKPLQSQLIIQGTRGVLRVDLFLMFHATRSATPLPKAAERIVNAMSDSIQPLIDVPRGVIGFLRGQIRPFHGIQELVVRFYQALREGDPVPVSVAAALPVVEWTERVARAAEAEHEAGLGQLPRLEGAAVLVTGASGGLGSAIVDKLLEQGMRVRLFVRRPPVQIREGVEIALGDLGDPRAVDRAVAGVDSVIHAGAAMKGGWPEHHCATVVGTRNVLEACKKHGVQKLVHISSLSVVDWGGAEPDSPITEASPLEPRPVQRGAYTQAKLHAERLVREYAEQENVPAVILRPGQIFGGRIPLLTPAVGRRVGRRWLVLGDGKVRLPLVYLDDVLDAVQSALFVKLHRGEIIQLVDPTAYSQNDVLAALSGDAARVIRLPRGFVFAGGWFSERLLGLARRSSPLSVYRLRAALAKRRFESIHAEPLLGWKPRVGVTEGIRRLVGAEQPAGALQRHGDVMSLQTSYSRGATPDCVGTRTISEGRRAA